ncbi:hypothetical protein BVX93_01745, partial [bacterium B13(2017)]
MKYLYRTKLFIVLLLILQLISFSYTKVYALAPRTNTTQDLKIVELVSKSIKANPQLLSQIKSNPSIFPIYISLLDSDNVIAVFPDT